MEIEKTLEQFEENGRSFARCMNCGRLIIVEDRTNKTKRLIEAVKGEFTGLEFNKSCLCIANGLSKCCNRPNFIWIALYINLYPEKNFQSFCREFQGQFQ